LLEQYGYGSGTAQGLYMGPRFQTVSHGRGLLARDDGFDRLVFRGPGPDPTYNPGEGEWVERYELQGRTSHGRKWVSLGFFRGNSDPLTEVAHSLGEYALKGRKGLRLRYLRFRPLSAKQGGFYRHKAMRVCVFGLRDGEEVGGDEKGAVARAKRGGGGGRERGRRQQRIESAGTAATAAEQLPTPQ
jgi:hypothetical protein